MYTPIIKKTGERIEIKNPAFSEKFDFTRSRKKKGTVIDLDNMKKYLITGASCGLPNCNCDAYAEEIK